MLLNAVAFSSQLPHTSTLQKFEGEAILLFADPKMVYGTAGWLLAVEPEAADELLEVSPVADMCHVCRKVPP